jgi:uncharacterized protein
MPLYDLSPVESRILGCLLEKERLTPEAYPLSLNSLTLACNQTTNREPILGLDEKTVEAGLDGLRDKKLATMVWGAGARVQRFRHNLLAHYNLDPRDVAVLCVLMLRGAQTPGELRARTERMHAFAGVEDVEACLAALAAGDDPLVRMLPARPGQKEKRYVELFSAAVAAPVAESAAPVAEGAPAGAASGPVQRLAALEAEVAALRAELEAVRTEFAAFRKQFE